MLSKHALLVALASSYLFCAYAQASDRFITKIVGGDDTTISVAPSTVALLDSQVFDVSGSARFAQFCGGTVIHEKFVLTAAHCVFRTVAGVQKTVLPTDILVLSGSTDLSAPTTIPVSVVDVVPHPQYTEARFGSDLAMLELSAPIDVPVAELELEAIELNDVGAVFGWGALNEGDSDTPQSVPNSLQGAVVFMAPPDVCTQIFTDHVLTTGTTVAPDQVCAAVAEGGVDSCQGDSGGPLYRLNEDNSVGKLVGVVSYGIGCARPNYPGVYSGVSLQTDFIRGVIDAATPTSIPTTNPSEPEPGPSEPEPGPTEPEPGPTEPEPGPTAPEPGPTAPEPGPTAPEPGPTAPEPGPTAPVPGASEPAPTEPTSGASGSNLDPTPSGGSGGGCSIGPQDAKDPLLPVLFLTSLIFTWRCRMRRKSSVGKIANA